MSSKIVSMSEACHISAAGRMTQPRVEEDVHKVLWWVRVSAEMGISNKTDCRCISRWRHLKVGPTREEPPIPGQ